jgi:hypothetical protein
MDLGTLIGIGTGLIIPGIGFIVWLVRLEGRINTERELRENQHTNTVDRINSFEQRIYDTLKEIQSTLRDKVDRH